MQTLLKESTEYVTQGLICVQTMARIVSDIRMFSRSDMPLSRIDEVLRVLPGIEMVASAQVAAARQDLSLPSRNAAICTVKRISNNLSFF